MHDRHAAAAPDPATRAAALEWNVDCDTRTFPAIQMPIAGHGGSYPPYHTVLQVVSMAEVPPATLMRPTSRASSQGRAR